MYLRGWYSLANHISRAQCWFAFLGPQIIAMKTSRKTISPGSVRVGVEDEPSQMDITATDHKTELTMNKTTSIATDGLSKLPGRKLQNCICGWSKLTTVNGLKIHQGRKKCFSELRKESLIHQCFLKVT